MGDLRSDFRRVLAAEVVSNFGSMLSRLAIPWIATLALDATPLEMGFIVVADLVAGAMGSLLLGAAVDRMAKRAVMVATDIARAALLAAVAALAATHLLSFWMLIVAAAASGLLTIMFELARSAWMVQRIEVAELPARNAQVSAGGSISETVAFAIGGWLYQWLGATLALLVDAASYLCSALFLRKLKDEAPVVTPNPAPTSMRSLVDDARAGLAAIAAVPALRTIATIEALVALAMSLAGTSYMIFVARNLAFETGILGMIFAAGGIGSVFGAAMAPAMGRRLGTGRAMLIALCLLALGAICIPLAPGASIAGAILLIAHQVIGDGGRTIYDVHDRTIRQTATTSDKLARVDAGIRTVGQLAALVGALGGGALATLIGARFALALSAGLLAAAAIVAYYRLVRGTQGLSAR